MSKSVRPKYAGVSKLLIFFRGASLTDCDLYVILLLRSVSMDLKKTRGFTLVEMLAVLSIILLLVGLLSPALKKAREQAKVGKARAMVGSLEVAINMFYTDTGEYPDNLGELVNPPDTDYGPYMDIKDFKNGKFLDPWGREYQYKEPGDRNPRTFDVWSNGTERGKEIGNW